MNVHRFIFAVLLTAIAAVAAGSPAEPREVSLEVTDSGGYILAGKPVLLSDLRARLRELKATGEPIRLDITGRGNVEYSDVTPAVQIAQEEGLAKLGVVTVSPTTADASASPATR